MFNILIVSLYAFLGASIKFIDDAFDRRVFSKRAAYLLVPVAGLLWGYAMSLSGASATILVSILIIVIFTRKVDNNAFLVGLVCALGGMVLFNAAGFMLIPLAVILLAAFLDEVFSDWADTGKIHGVLKTFFEFRPWMKLGVLGLALANFFGLIYFLAFMCFDLAYITVDLIAQKMAQKT